MAKRITEPKSKSSTAKKDAELRKLLDKPNFPSFDRMMRKLIEVPKKKGIETAPQKRGR
jgi:hypothetical protein